MERKRTCSRVISEEEDDEEEDWDRRISLRNRKRVRYNDDDYDDEDEDEDEDVDVEEEDEEEGLDNKQPGPSNQRKQESRHLFVTCGNRTGILDVEKLHLGESCIRCEGSWFSPPEFEEFGGKGSSKKWKASIFYENKPLQFWFEQGSLTTNGFKRRGSEPTKQKKIRSSNHIPESPTKESEIQSAEETQEDDVKDEDWLPGSEELALETEEGEKERVGAENGEEVVDSGVDKSKEEEDKMEKGEMEDEDMPGVADNDKDNCVFEERKPKLIISTAENVCVLLKEVEVIVQRLPEIQAKRDCQSNWRGHPVEDSLREPRDEDAQHDGEREHKGSVTDDPSVAAAAHVDPSAMSRPPIVGGVTEENRGELTQSGERKENGQRQIKRDPGNSPTPLSARATSSPDIKTETEGIRSTSNHTATHVTSPGLLVTDSDGDLIDQWEGNEETGHCGEKEGRKRSEMGPETQRQWIEGLKDKHLDMSGSTAGGQAFAPGNIRDVLSDAPPVQRCIKEESIEAMSGGPPTHSQSVLVECKYEHTDAATTSGHDGAGCGDDKRKLETGFPQATRASGDTPSSDMVEGPSSRPSTSCNLDTMDLDQLRREKIKMQIKVLKLQEEYYTQKIKEQKK